MAKTTENVDFETSMHELETLMQAMEKGDLSLEQSLEHYRRGAELIKSCKQILMAAEQEILRVENDTLSPLDADIPPQNT